MNDRYIASVDLGTGKIALTVAHIHGDNIDIVFYKETPSDGIRYSQVFNPQKASTPLKAVIHEAEDELGIKIMQVVIGLPRYCVRQESAPAKIERSDPASCITLEEIDSIKNQALDEYPITDPDNETIYGAVTQSFGTEDMINIPEEDIVGMTGSLIEGNFKVFVGDRKYIRDIDTMLNLAGIAPARKVFLPDAIAGAVLNGEEKDSGVALIEMGAGVTSLSIYQGGILRHYSSIPFGGKAISSDIKYVCRLKETLAENIKMAYGVCMPDRLQSMGEKIIQINYDDDGTSKQVEVKYLSEIITCRVKEILEAILFKIEESGYADKLRAGIVITGGCANLTGLSAFVREMSGYNVRIGYPRCKFISSSGYPGISETSAAASVGLLLSSKDDTHLNCTTEPVAKAPVDPADLADNPDNPDIGIAGQEGDGTLFPDEVLTADTKGTKSGSSKKNPGKKKFNWGIKIVDSVGTLFNSIDE